MGVKRILAPHDRVRAIREEYMTDGRDMGDPPQRNEGDEGVDSAVAESYWSMFYYSL